MDDAHGGTLGRFCVTASVAQAQPTGASRLTSDDPNNWPMYHRSYDGYRLSPLAQINKANVKDLQVAWVHQSGVVVQGLEATPLVIDGVMYYIASNNRVFALDGATGKEIWHYYTKLDPVVTTLFFQPYNRGLAAGHGNVYFGTLDGRVIALNMKTGKEAWVTTLLDTKKCSCNFTGAPLVVKDKVILGQTAGELPIQGKIFAVKALNGRRPGSSTRSRMTRRAGGRVGEVWGRRRVDDRLLRSRAQPRVLGHRDPRPTTIGAARGLATTSTPRRCSRSIPTPDSSSGTSRRSRTTTGTTTPAWARASSSTATGRSSSSTRTRAASCSSRSEERQDPQRVADDPHLQLREDHRSKTGELIERNPPREVGKPKFICPWIAGGRSWNSGSYNPVTKLWYNTAMEVCEEVTVEKQTPVTEPAAGLFFGGDQVAKHRRAVKRTGTSTPTTGHRRAQVDRALQVPADRQRALHRRQPRVPRGRGGRGARLRWRQRRRAVELPHGLRPSGRPDQLLRERQAVHRRAQRPGVAGAAGIYPALWPEVEHFPAGSAISSSSLK